MINNQCNLNSPSIINLFATQIGDQLSQHDYEQIYRKLPRDEQFRINQFKGWRNRQRALIAAFLVQWSLKKFSINNHPVHIERTDLGRPYVKDLLTWSGDFNLSHSGDWIILALTDKGNVGVDIEKIELIDEEIFYHALTNRELVLLEKVQGSEKLALFYKIWTMKEAVYKTGLYPNTSFLLIDTLSIDRSLSIHTKILNDSYVCSVCSNNVPAYIDFSVLKKEEAVSFSETTCITFGKFREKS